ncbi:MAG: hypothetical protein ACK420_01140, partial [Sphingomonadales bacterium]
MQLFCLITANQRQAEDDQSISTDTVTLTLKTPISITTNPSSTTICSGSIATLSVVAGGTTPTYQWYRVVSGVASAITGANAATYTTTTAGTYYATVTNDCGTQTSANAVVTINPVPQGSLSGSAILASATSGANLTYTSSVAGTGPYTIVYTASTGGTYTASNVVSGVAFPVSVLPTVTTGYSLVSISDANGCVQSSASNFTAGVATITVNAVPTATISGSQSICPNTSTALTLTMSGTGTKTVVLSDGTQATFGPGVTVGTITVTPNAPTTYTVASYSDANGAGTVAGSAVISFNSAVAITTQPANTTVCSGTTATLNAAASGTGVTYQWYELNTTTGVGTPISGANAATYSTTTAGTYYV